ncbi:DUF2844 domain-containing protein [Trinickia caryophylli]|uniref:DUF2844 domain-containing protein n=1 Tax=Trinickia caryophylli TaxID=28094 RepID=A0A1X7H647_TRICW|nr:DUF2844 domain-containing protein [Trinickia caryophylli]PMS13287.1 DUF2844 domain-containing protein [Trinickia caryophylli]TRX19186.1 DUF2844 domain-containing protein [Trinickia caryophylli]WQE13516.1 DUF2844 domain-containing protein [Trinickia caryophylli]SMF80202.1 Protein of unknown function [Trinickia caryophylli]GLU33952.1 hypothetical protein Busp01_37940 [Trinickia caryophylli]
MTIRFVRVLLPAAIAAGAVAVCAPAYAVLGGAPMTTPSGATAKTVNPVARAASTTSTSTSTASSAAAYTVKETTLSSGTVVREYVGTDGNVFGIAWKGPFAPDLATLLGSYFPQYTSAVEAQRAQRVGHGPVAVKQSGLVVHSGGHMGLYFGNAYLPDSLPSGLSATDIQ